MLIHWYYYLYLSVRATHPFFKGEEKKKPDTVRIKQMNHQQRSRNILKNVGYNLLSEGKTIRIKAHGYSMYPCIKPGAVILIEPIRIKGKPVAGEIIAVRRESGLIVHRLIKIVSKDGVDYYIARGDSNARTDEPIKIDMIAGRIVRAEYGSAGLADISIDPRPNHILNRIKVIGIILWKRVRKFIK